LGFDYQSGSGAVSLAAPACLSADDGAVTTGEPWQIAAAVEAAQLCIDLDRPVVRGLPVYSLDSIDTLYSKWHGLRQQMKYEDA